MDLFATHATVTRLDAALAVSVGAGAARTEILVELAWHLRQRDTLRALLLAAEASALLKHAAPSAPQQRKLLARLDLVRAEADWLNSAPASANDALAQAKAQFAQAQDNIGMGDCCWLEANVAVSRGNPKLADTLGREATHRYGDSGDKTRTVLAKLSGAMRAASFDPADARRRLSEAGLTQSTEGHVACACWLAGATALLHLHQGDASAALTQFMTCHALALETGQIRFAAISATNAGIALTNLNNYSASLEWHEIALTLARETGWPSLIGIAGCRTAEAMTKLGAHQGAVALLRESLPKIEPGTIACANAMAVMGKSLLASGEYAQASDFNLKSIACLRAIATPLGLIGAMLAQTETLMRLGQPVDAKALGHEALQVARANRLQYLESHALTLLARVCRSTAGHGQGGATLADQALPYLVEALRIASSVDGYIVPPDLLELLAQEHAERGDMAAAYRTSVDAGKSRERCMGREAHNRATALQVRHDSQRIKLAAKHQQALSRAEDARANQLQQANDTLKALSEAGQNITAALDFQAVATALGRHLDQMLAPHAVALYRLNAADQTLQLVFSRDNAAASRARSIPVANPQLLEARCARDLCEIVGPAGPAMSSVDNPARPLHRAIAFPMCVGPRLLGVISLESAEPHFGERERAICRSLCAYGAIALANADAHATLKDAQSRLIEQNIGLERLATVDPLTHLANRRHLNIALKREHAHALRSGTPYSLILLDIDHFKQVNDLHGHLVGDEVLVAIGSLIAHRARDCDLPGRWGGEEFMVLLPGAQLEAAARFGESLREIVAAHRHLGNLQCTVSIGAATFHPDDGLTSVVERADRALYAAKAAGRNTVCTERDSRLTGT